jgi:hypothetical protein
MKNLDRQETKKSRFLRVKNDQFNASKNSFQEENKFEILTYTKSLFSYKKIICNTSKCLGFKRKNVGIFVTDLTGRKRKIREDKTITFSSSKKERK